MSSTPKLGITEHAESQVNGEVVANTAYRKLEAASVLEVLDRDLTAPPGSPVDGATYIVGAAATGAWAGQDGKVAVYANGWIFFTPKGGMIAFVKDEKQWWAYSSAESEWHPMQRIRSLTEHWTGLYQDGKKIYSKCINCNSLLPDIATDPQNHPHGITGLDFSETILVEGSLQIPGASYSAPLPYIGSTGGVVEVGIDATNLFFNVNFDAGTSFGMRVEWVRLEYCKT